MGTENDPRSMTEAASRVYVEGVGWVPVEAVPAALVVAGADIGGLSDAPVVDRTG